MFLNKRIYNLIKDDFKILDPSLNPNSGYTLHNSVGTNIGIQYEVVDGNIVQCARHYQAMERLFMNLDRKWQRDLVVFALMEKL